MKNKISPLILFFFVIISGVQAQVKVIDSLDLKKIMLRLEKAPYTAINLDSTKLIERLSEKINFTTGVIFAKLRQNDHYRRVGDFENALKACQEVYEFGEERKNKKIIAKSHYAFGAVYEKMREFEKAENYYRKHLDYSKTAGDDFEEGRAISAIGTLNINQGKPQQALEYLLEANKILSKYNTAAELAPLINNIAVAYLQMGKTDKSIPYFEEILEVYENQKDSANLARTYGNIAYSYQSLGDFKQAFAQYDSSLFYSESLGRDDISYITYLDKSECHDLAGDISKALKYHRKYHRLFQKVFDDKAKSRIDEWEVRLDTEKKEKELLSSQNEVSKLKVGQQKMWLLIGSLIASLIIGFLIFLKARGDARRKEELRKIQAQLMQSELKNKELEALKLQGKLENKQADLTNFALDIARKNEFSKQLTDQLDVLQKAKTNEVKPKLREIISFTVNHLQINDDLALLQDNVDNINQEFNKKLDARFNNLTTNDKYLAGLIRLNLSNKDIASIKGISANSAKVNRYRLRKKLGLEAEEDVVAFLQGV